MTDNSQYFERASDVGALSKFFYPRLAFFKIIVHICIGLEIPIKWTGASPVGKGLKRNLNSFFIFLPLGLESLLVLVFSHRRSIGCL